MKNLFLDMKKVLSYPFTKNLSFFLLLFMFSTIVFSINIIVNSNLYECIYATFFRFLQCYILCLFIPLWGRFKNIFKSILILLVGMNFFGDILMFAIGEVRFNFLSGVVLGTNLNEAIEFILSTLTIKHYFILIIIILSFYFLSKYTPKILSSLKLRLLLGYTILLISIPTVAVNRGNWITESTFLGKYFILYSDYSYFNHDLEDYLSKPKLSFAKDSLPDNVVVIIGESFSKHFSSLYGYKKNTNPRLQTLTPENLCLFNNVKSYSTQTQFCLQSIMSSLSSREPDKDWFRCITLPEILSILDYKTYWISNQFEQGLCDNVTTKYAHLCDSSCFVGLKHAVGVNPYPDEIVLPTLKEISNRDSSKKVVFVHLYGSHPKFSARYPLDRTYFKDSDYLDFDKSQRKTRSEYDNAILYNDSVVYEIFDLFKEKNAIGFYFSDHGLDIYHTRKDYAAHGIKSDPESVRISKDIPFMVYTTNRFKRTYPDLMDKIHKSVNRSFVTEDFMYSLMDILGVHFADNDDVKKYSLFSQNKKNANAYTEKG